jgi:hypothetical protein
MPDNQNDTVSSRRHFLKSAWAVPVVATFALGASAVSASAHTSNATDSGICWLVEKEPFANKGILEALLGCGKEAPSDRRLKHDIRFETCRSDGLRLYSYRYLGGDRRFIGVMAQDLLQDARFAPAVITTRSGVMLVDYDRLGLEVPDLAAMRDAGFAAIAVYEPALSS